jgi:hypothetical protein
MIITDKPARRKYGLFRHAQPVKIDTDIIANFEIKVEEKK